MKDYASMSDFEINCRVHTEVMEISGLDSFKAKDYCNNPADAWPIIVDSSISLIKCGDSWLAAEKGYGYEGIIGDDDFCGYGSGAGVEGENPIRAAMIVFLMMKEGEL